MKSYDDFKHAIRDRESSNRYDCKNEYGFLGAYQFGKARLCDLGLTERVLPGFANRCFTWKGDLTEILFLTSTELQDDCFDRHVQLFKRNLVKVLRMEDSLSGAVAACHLVGYQAFLDWYRTGKERKDAYGTTASQYYNLFRDYEIP